MGAPGTTDGPWVYRDSLVIRDERGAEIAHVIGYRSGPEPEVLFANARQIAASPDLYDALEKLRIALDLIDPTRPLQYAETMSLMRNCADAALAKARGES